MEERYTRLYTLESDTNQENTPVIVLAGALLKDNQYDSVLVQLKLQNVVDNIITSVTVNIQPLNDTKEMLGSEIKYQYLGLSIQKDEIFGQKVPIRLPDKDTRQFVVKIMEVAFEDGSKWSTEVLSHDITSDSEPLKDDSMVGDEIIDDSSPTLNNSVSTVKEPINETPPVPSENETTRTFKNVLKKNKLIAIIIAAAAVLLLLFGLSKATVTSETIPIQGIFTSVDGEYQFFSTADLRSIDWDIDGEMILYSDNTVYIDARLIDEDGSRIQTEHVEKGVMDKDSDGDMQQIYSDSTSDTNKVYTIKEGGKEVGWIFQADETYMYVGDGKFGFIFLKN